MKKLLVILAVLGMYNLHAQQLAVPTISLESGFYTSDVVVTVSHPEPGVTIFYSLNGSDPTPLDQTYTGPLTMTSRVGDADNFSLIPTNPSFLYPIGDYTQQRADNRGWLAPFVSEVYKVNVLRVRAYKAGFVPSETATKTYVIDPLGSAIYSMPIVSFVADSIDLFSNPTGIYKWGDHIDGNYTQKGAAWERTGYFEFFENDGTVGVQRDIRMRIHGGGSRHSGKKTFRIYAEHAGYKNFKYPFFEDYNQDKFKRILLRTGGHRPDCFPRDNLANYITKGLNVDQQHYRHVIAFINGEYWGIHSIKERVDKYFIQNHYGIDDDEVTILDQEYDVQDGYAMDSLEMVKIEARADTSDMTDPANLKWITDRIDIENYIDYMGAEIFLSNEDWVFSNVVLWRRTGNYDPSLGPGQDGKFRWLFYDFDGAYGGSCSNAYYTVNTLANATVPSGFAGPYTRLFRGMLENETFRHDWINRTCDLMNSNFRANVLHEKLDSMYAELTPEMPDEVDRWRYPSEATTLADRQLEIPSLIQWDTSFYYLNRFADRRQRKVREHIMDKWGYPDTSKITIDVNDVTMGTVQINTIQINNQLPGVDPGVYPWLGHYIDSVPCRLIAIPLPGYEFVEWQETGELNDTIAWIPDGDITYTAVFQAESNFSPIVINELMPSNSTNIVDNFGDNDDWIELFNPNPYPVNISNCRFELGMTSTVIPAGTIIEADGYLVFWADNETYQGDNHLDFKLPNANNTSLVLYHPDGNVMDFVTYPQTTTDYSWGRYPNGSASFGDFEVPTPYLNNDITGIQDGPKLLTTLMGYPNPTTGLMNLNKTTDYTVFSLDGKVVLTAANTNMVNLAHLQQGNYVLRSVEGETLKIVVRK